MTEAISAEFKLACARRELAMRRRVYPRWLEEGRISKALAAREIRGMEAIVADYEAIVKKELLL